MRPNEPVIHKAGVEFSPVEVEDRPTHILLPEGVSPLDPYTLWELYYTPDIIDSIVVATNGYKRKVGEGKRARGKAWYKTTPQEIYVFLALRIYMTLHVENEIAHYWNTSNMKPTHPISKYISKDRFMELHIRYRVGQDTSTAYTRVITPIIHSTPTLILYSK